MHRDETRILESPAEQVLRATFANDEASEAFLRESAKGDDPRLRIIALRGLARRGLDSPSTWLHALDDRDVRVVREALELLARRATIDRTVLDVVAASLGNEDDLVVEASAFCLGEHHVRDAVASLCTVATSHADPRCREAAVAALGSIGDDAALTVLIGALDDKAPVRRRAIVALYNFEGPEVDQALANAEEDRDWQVRAAVAQLRSQD